MVGIYRSSIKTRLAALLCASGVWLSGNALAAVTGGPSGPLSESGNIVIQGNVVNRTCVFSPESTTVVALDTINISQLQTPGIKSAKGFDVLLNCGDAATSVKLVIEGIADGNNSTLFSNNGSAKNIALALRDNEGNVLTPSGMDSVIASVVNQQGRYQFTAGYQSTGAGPLKAGSLLSYINLLVKYD